MIDVLVTMRFDDSQLARLRAVSPRLSVRREDAGKADYSDAEILYAARRRAIWSGRPSSSGCSSTWRVSMRSSIIRSMPRAPCR